jgi:hypothetical protein
VWRLSFRGCRLTQSTWAQPPPKKCFRNSETFRSIVALTTRAVSSAGSEHLPYKQRVGGSNPSLPTRVESHEEPVSQRLTGFLFCTLPLPLSLACSPPAPLTCVREEKRWCAEVLFATLEDDATLRLLFTVRAFGAHAAHNPRTRVILERLSGAKTRRGPRLRQCKGTRKSSITYPFVSLSSHNAVCAQEWRNWQTHWTQNPAGSPPCGFDSRLLHFMV